MPNEIRTYQEGVAIVTGGGSGIGAALSRELAARGARVFVADRHRESALETKHAIEAAGGRAEARELDVRDAAAFEKLAGEVAEICGRIDYFFNNAGIGVGGESLAVTTDDWRYIVDVNVMGVVHGVQAVYPRMVAQGFGHIVSTASMAGLVPSPLATAYSATKHAVVGLSRGLRLEAETQGVRVSALCPGVIRTPILTGGRYGRVKGEVTKEKMLALWERTRPMDPAMFAKQVLDQVARNREIIIVPGTWRIAWWVDRVLPALFHYFAARSLRGARAQLAAGSTKDP
jgi:NAD(P)-dependent dehydrogenase (short-subunit alcohol dehydrogenase family)